MEIIENEEALKPKVSQMSTPSSPNPVDPVYKEIVDRVTDRLFSRLLIWTLCVGIPAVGIGGYWLATSRSDVNKRLDNIDITLKRMATAAQVSSVLDATKDSFHEVTQALNSKRPPDDKYINDKFDDAKARLLALVPEWNLPNAVAARAYRAFDTNRIAYLVAEKTIVKSPIEGEIESAGADGSSAGTLSVKIRTKTESKTAAQWRHLLTSAQAKEKIQEVALSGLTSVSVKSGDLVLAGQIVGEVQPSNSWLIAELWMEYRVDGQSQTPPPTLPVSDHGEEVFTNMCHQCHGSARSVTATSPDTPSLCNLKTRKLIGRREPSPDNVLQAARTGNYHKGVQRIPDAELKFVVAFVLRNSPAWGVSTSGLQVPGHKPQQ